MKISFASPTTLDSPEHVALAEDLGYERACAGVAMWRRTRVAVPAARLLCHDSAARRARCRQRADGGYRSSSAYSVPK